MIMHSYTRDELKQHLLQFGQKFELTPEIHGNGFKNFLRLGSETYVAQPLEHNLPLELKGIVQS